MHTSIKIDQLIALELIDSHHAEPLYLLVKDNRHHLREWLPWVDNMRTVDDFRKYINFSKQRQANEQELGYIITADQNPIGRIGLHNIDLHNQSAFIGYWLAQAWEGKGIMTRCCQTLIQNCFTKHGLNRIEIRCGTGNVKSQAIPERLGFKREGIIRQGEFVNNQFIDLLVYALLKEEWKDS